VLHELSTSDVRDNVIESIVKTGLFKRRLIHVARRFGAVSNEADFSNISLNLLSKSFLDTAIYDEALNEAITKDLDVVNTKAVLEDIKNRDVDLVKVRNDEATPITKIGLEKMGRRYNLIAPEKMRMISIESAKARLLNEVKTLVCTSCQKYIQMVSIKDLPNNVICPKCSSGKIGVLSCAEREVRKIFDKGRHIRSTRDKEAEEYALKTAKLVEAHGLLAVIVLSGKNLRLPEVEGILSTETNIDDKLFALIIAAEKKALTRSFW
jgi:ATP-dependent Lhr-like helicase